MDKAGLVSHVLRSKNRRYTSPVARRPRTADGTGAGSGPGGTAGGGAERRPGRTRPAPGVGGATMNDLDLDDDGGTWTEAQIEWFFGVGAIVAVVVVGVFAVLKS